MSARAARHTSAALVVIWAAIVFLVADKLLEDPSAFDVVMLAAAVLMLAVALVDWRRG